MVCVVPIDVSQSRQDNIRGEQIVRVREEAGCGHNEDKPIEARLVNCLDKVLACFRRGLLSNISASLTVEKAVLHTVPKPAPSASGSLLGQKNELPVVPILLLEVHGYYLFVLKEIIATQS